MQAVRKYITPGGSDGIKEWKDTQGIFLEYDGNDLINMTPQVNEDIFIS